MLRHQLKLAFRSLRKSRSAFLINLIGLSTGMACALLIYSWVMDELRIDRFHEKDDRLYQVLQNLPLPGEIRTFEATPGLLVQALAEEMPEVEYAAAVIPGTWFSDKGILSVGVKHIKTAGQFVSEDYFRIFSWNIIEGNKGGLLKDKYAVLLSDELAKKLFSTTEGVVGKTVRLWGEDLQIIGVTRNFHIESLYEPVKPCFFYHLPNRRNVLVKIQAGREHATIEQIAGLYEEFTQDLPFEYQFVNEEFRELYASEQRVATLSGYFAGMAILISCLGLFGLASYTTFLRTKEIGIRKILGASLATLTLLLSKDFLKLILLALVIATPVAWYFIRQWLLEFPYRVDIEWWMFAAAGAAAVVLAFLAVSIEIFKAALANPVDSLRNE